MYRWSGRSWQYSIVTSRDEPRYCRKWIWYWNKTVEEMQCLTHTLIWRLGLSIISSSRFRTAGETASHDYSRTIDGQLKISYRLYIAAGVRGVATAGDTGDASSVRPTMSPYIKVSTDSLSSEMTFDEWRGVILQRIIRPTLLLHVINHYTTCCF